MKKTILSLAFVFIFVFPPSYCLAAEPLPLKTISAEQAYLPNQLQKETPWPWYITRSSGLIAFALLYISILLGVSTRIPFLNRMCGPLYCDNTHCWISAQALFFALVHPIALLFDQYINFSIKDILIPFASDYHPLLVSFGIIGLYSMIILVFSSYLKKYLSFIFWRLTHWVSVPLYLLTVIHAYFLGTDLKNAFAKIIFIAINALLMLLFMLNLHFRTKNKKVPDNTGTLPPPIGNPRSNTNLIG